MAKYSVEVKPPARKELEALPDELPGVSSENSVPAQALIVLRATAHLY